LSKLDEVENEDRDGDGVADLKDRCAATPKGVEVDKEGCPLDDDQDGIPDYRDRNPKSDKGEIVDQNGASVNYELVAQRWTDSPDVYGVSWDKNYQNPRFREDEGYTVNVDITDKDNRSPNIQKVLRIPELRKEILNDSLVVYRLGVYEKYEDVETKRQELVDDGIYTAYSVPENASMESVDQLTGLPRVDDEVIVNSYGIKESIDLIKTSDARSFPQLEYTISRFERYLFENVQEVSLVEAYLQAITAFVWDETVKRSSDTVYARLEKYPVPGFVKRVGNVVTTELAESNNDDSIESTDVDVVVESEMTVEESVAQDKDEEEAIEKEAAAAVTEFEDVKEVAAIESEPSDGAQSKVEERVTEPVVAEAPEEQEQVTQTQSSQPENSNVNPEVLEGEELAKAIEQIRSTSNLKKQPRINYAPVKPQFKAADVNNDQLISALEIQMVLEDILKGSSEFTDVQFNEMNAYFTEFTQNVEPIDFGGTKVAFVNGVLTILKTEGGEYEEDSRRLLARKYREADFNKDGELTPDEVQRMIDLFMKGASPYSQEKVHELIDLFFD
jgi:hypothetical protein